MTDRPSREMRRLEKLSNENYILHEGDPELKETQNYVKSRQTKDELMDAYDQCTAEVHKWRSKARGLEKQMKDIEEFDVEKAKELIADQVRDTPYENDTVFHEHLIMSMKLNNLNNYVKARAEAKSANDQVAFLEKQVVEIKMAVPEVLRNGAK